MTLTNDVNSFRLESP